MGLEGMLVGADEGGSGKSCNSVAGEGDREPGMGEREAVLFDGGEDLSTVSRILGFTEDVSQVSRPESWEWREEWKLLTVEVVALEFLKYARG